MVKEIRITTIDNPYDPFKQWDEWLLYDTNKGYHTCKRLAAITRLSEQLSDEENNETVEEGIKELIRYGAIDKQGNIIEYKTITRN